MKKKTDLKACLGTSKMFNQNKMMINCPRAIYSIIAYSTSVFMHENSLNDSSSSCNDVTYSALHSFVKLIFQSIQNVININL